MQFLILFGFNFLGIFGCGLAFSLQQWPMYTGRQTALFCNYAESKQREGLRGLMVCSASGVWTLALGSLQSSQIPWWLQASPLVFALLNGASLSNLLPAVRLFLPPYSPPASCLAPFKCLSNPEITEVWKVGVSISPCWIRTIDCKLPQILALLPFMCVTLHFGLNHISSCIYNINNLSAYALNTQKTLEYCHECCLKENQCCRFIFSSVQEHFFKIVSVFEMFVNGFCSLSSHLRAAVVNGSVEDGQEKREHRFWQRNWVRVYVCMASTQKWE